MGGTERYALPAMAVYLVVAAHPDDPDFGVAGTAARLAKDGHEVHYLMLTSGDAGSEDPTIPPLDLMRLREAEQEAAGRILGLSGVHFLRYPDGELQPTLEACDLSLREARGVLDRLIAAGLIEALEANGVSKNDRWNPPSP